MKTKAVSILALIFFIVFFYFAKTILEDQRKELIVNNPRGYVLPSRITGPISLEFKGIVSDFIFLKMTTFFGGKHMDKEVFQEDQILFIYEAMKILTDLDPWFWDAYLFASMTLAWDFRRVDLANELLEKARQYRDEDFKPVYYLGFHHFYFLKDNKKGAEYLMEASKKPGAPSYIATLAARLSMYENQYKSAILFLGDILKNTKEMKLKKLYEQRLRALIIMDKLEHQVHKYNKQFGQFPETLDDLVENGLIEFIPEDPYGGKFILLKNRRVYTTSKMRSLQQKDES